MPIPSQCSNCGAFTRRSIHYEEEYQNSVLLERLRTTNFPPTDQEISHVRHTILSALSNDISSVDAKIASLQAAITSMEEERERLSNVQKKYNDLISSHRALPLEIWSKIFLYTLPSTFQSNAFDARGTIWQISHVCQRWRIIALSLGSFWSTFRIFFPEAALRERNVQRLQTVIQRSCQGLLDITLAGEIPEAQMPGSHSSIFERIFDVILAESYRWRKLSIEPITPCQGWDSLYAQLHNRLPRLESLGLHCVQLMLKQRSIFGECPSLTTVTLSGRLQVVDLPWEQLTELDLSSMDMDVDDETARIACMNLIGRCPSVEILSLPRWYCKDAEEVYTPMTCSNLRRLKASSVPVLDALTLPRLRSVSLLPEPSRARGDILYPFKRLLIRSGCLSALTSLSLLLVPLTASPEHNLHSILSQTCNLASFSLSVYLHGSQVDDINVQQVAEIVNSLEITPSKTVTFLPALSSLDISVLNHIDEKRVLYFGPFGKFASTLTARWKGDDSAGLARLRTCHFAVHTERLLPHVFRQSPSRWHAMPLFSEAEKSTFTALVDDGMDLSIRVTSKLTLTNGVIFAVSR